ncbi:MAG: cell division protein ZipA C-terminal FtsZ-binding domain-containing protein [Burkholderiales bacterium]
MNISQWLGDTSSLWLSLGALITIAVLVVLMFNAFQGRARRGSMGVQDDPAQQPVDPSSDSVTSQVRNRPSLEDRIEPSFLTGSNGEPHTDPVRGRTVTEGIDPSFDLRFPPDIEPDDGLPAGAASDQSSHAAFAAAGQGSSSDASDRESPSNTPGSGVSGAAGAATARSGVTAQRRILEGGSLPTAADWGVLDDRIDCMAVLQMAPAVDCIALRSGAQTLSRIGSKSVIAEVQLADGGWCDVRAAEGLAARMRLGILLANRQGPLSASEFAEFAEKLRRLAGKVGVPDLRLPETMGVLERARQVDDFCARLDTLIGVNVLSGKGIAPARVVEIAESLQMIPRGHQRYARMSQSGDVLFMLAQAERPEMLTCVLDVPRAPAAEQPWSRMVEAARRCAELLDAQIVDDAMAPLSDAAAQAVSRQLQSHYAQLAGAGLDAGSPAALRVFN